VSYVTNHAHVNRTLASSLVGPAPWWFGPWSISFPAGFPRTDIDPRRRAVQDDGWVEAQGTSPKEDGNVHIADSHDRRFGSSRPPPSRRISQASSKTLWPQITEKCP